MTSTVLSSHFVAFARIQALTQRAQAPKIICTGIFRLQAQKALLLKTPGTVGGGTGLERILDILGENGLLVLLGSGVPDFERFFTRVSARRPNFLFLNGYSEACAEALYASGDLFVMPSTYEPCGISQMLAMRAGQPCLVHAVGGLRDTVTHGQNGFSFGGRNLAEQVDQMSTTFKEATGLITQRPDQWRAMRRNAAASRFPWSRSAGQYIRVLYAP